MKPNVKLLIAVALLATACTTGSKVTTGGYSDDLYFTPGDAPLSAPRAVRQAKQPEKKSTVAMEVEENEQGKVVNNYIVPKSSRKDKNAYYFDDQPAYADTVMEYKDDKEQITINNYFEGEEMDYSTRIRSFYNPYFYDPYWDPYWDPYYGSAFSWGLGWGGFYGGYYGGWYNPWNPWYGYGYGGYGYGGYGYGGYGYGGFGYGGYGYGGYGYGYGGYGWGWTSGGYYAGGGGGWNSGNYYTGRQNSTGKRGGSNAVRYGVNNTRSGVLSGSGSFNGQVLGRNPNASSTRLPSVNGTNGAVQLTRPAVSGGVGATGTRQPSTREATVLQQGQGTNTMQGTPRLNRGETISNLRRSGTNNIQSSGAVNQSNMSSRPVSAGRDYTPTYNRPRMNTQPSYNNGSTRQYNTPQSNSNTQSTRYARPQSSGGSFGGAVRTQPSGSYQRGAASSSTTRSTATPSSSGRSSSPGYSGSNSSTRSYSSPTNSGGNSGGGSVGGSSGGSGGGGHSGGGGGSGRTR